MSGTADAATTGDLPRLDASPVREETQHTHAGPAILPGLAALRFAAAAWWVVSIAGHALFGAYIAGTYGWATLHGDWAAWNRVWPTGHVSGEPAGNLVVAAHVLLAAVVACCGPLQLIPALRRRAPWFHRWNGRIYVTVSMLVGLAGLAMLAGGRSLVGASQNGNVGINGILLVICAALAWHRARKRDFAAHRRWALRLFVLAAGVWLFRIGMAAWIAISGGIVGFDPATMRGPALWTLALGAWAVPLLVLQAYLHAERSRATGGRYAVAALLMVLTAATAFGVYRATVGMWLPPMLAR